jgi:hypothetical protein
VEIENDNDMESSIDEEYKYIIQILRLMGNAHFQVWCQYQAISYAGLLKGVDDLCESNILFVAGDLCGDRPVLVRFLL